MSSDRLVDSCSTTPSELHPKDDQYCLKINHNPVSTVIASAFTYGREDLLPDVFQRIVDELNTQAGGQLEEFKYYLERHIGLDGDEHGPMATRLAQSLCRSEESLWKIAEETAVSCLIARQKLWDGIYEAVRSQGVSSGKVSI